MHAEIVKRLVEINRLFYEEFGAAFAKTRSRLQPGVKKVLENLPREISILDLGCGNGALAQELAQEQHLGFYLGVDFSSILLAEAQRRVEGRMPPGFKVGFCQGDLALTNWDQWISPCAEHAGAKTGGKRTIAGENSRLAFDVIFMFASLHHVPGKVSRMDLLSKARGFLPAGKQLILSVWQFQHSPKWISRVQPWDLAGLQQEDLETGDTLLDWRFQLPGKKEQTGYRYVHLFSREELAELATASGFRVVEEFDSDGEGGRLSLYQVWEASN
jgi:tRNA (uracil-5-)-methyltransferase TRM9